MSKILVVEDEPGIAFGLRERPQTEGYEVVVSRTVPKPSYAPEAGLRPDPAGRHVAR